MKKTILFAGLLWISVALFGQQFEDPQLTGKKFDKVKVKVGGDFAIQYQMLDHHADSANLIPLGKGFNLPTANFIIDATLAKGIAVKLETYLSSRHHNDTWVKGGYVIMDELPFIKSAKIDSLMDYFTIRAGDMEVNFGDAHFRRSDNGNVTRNPFVGGYIMDAFITSPGLEIMYRNNGLLGMVGVSSGSLKPAITQYNSSDSTYEAINTSKELAYYGKLGFDKQLNSDLRLRVTGSGYYHKQNHQGALFSADRAGSRYYFVMNKETFSSNDVNVSSNHTSGRFGPGSANQLFAAEFDLFLKYKGFEMFGFYQLATGDAKEKDFDFNQFSVEGLYRLGAREQFYGGLRYDQVKGNSDVNGTGKDQTVSRVQIGAGWFIIESMVLKLEYVTQTYDTLSYGFGDAGFNGFMIEAGISF
jgi:hypothetical protein